MKISCSFNEFFENLTFYSHITPNCLESDMFENIFLSYNFSHFNILRKKRTIFGLFKDTV